MLEPAGTTPTTTISSACCAATLVDTASANSDTVVVFISFFKSGFSRFCSSSGAKEYNKGTHYS